MTAGWVVVIVIAIAAALRIAAGELAARDIPLGEARRVLRWYVVIGIGIGLAAISGV